MLIASNNLNLGLPSSHPLLACDAPLGSPYLRCSMASDTKVCTKCGEEKQLDEFYRDANRDRGRRSSCKMCHTKYRNENLERMRKRANAYYAAHKKQMALISRRCYLNNHTKRIEYHRKYYHENRELCIVRAKSRYAIQTERLIPCPCEICGTTERIEGHHEDYSKPLDVRWLCKSHHSLLHAQLKREKNEQTRTETRR